MHTAYQPVVEVLGDTLALMKRRERALWSSHDTTTDILAIADERFKAPIHINHSLSHVELRSRCLSGIMVERWFDQISNGKETLMRAAVPPSPVPVAIDRSVLSLYRMPRRTPLCLCWHERKSFAAAISR
jgi:hypothetical protein